MRASRLLSVLLLLQNRGRMTAKDLAEELEVSVRTVYRDIDSLIAAGVPVYAEHGPAGGYQLVSGYRTRLTGLTEQEADTLFLAGAPGPAAQLGLGADLAAAQLKLEASLSPDLRNRAARIRERFHLDAPSWFRRAEDTTHLSEVADAVWNQRSIRIRYQGWNYRLPPTEREINPLGVVCKAGTWYLIAATSDGKPHTYRVNRIHELEKLPGRFDRPPGFDLAEFWADWAQEFESKVYHGEMTVRLRPEAFPLLIHIWMPVAADAAQSADAPDPEGWRHAVIPIESENHAIREVLKLGPLIEVLEPSSLRERVAREAAETLALYES